MKTKKQVAVDQSLIGQKTNQRINIKAGNDFFAECEKGINN